jgi:hypothetical protein
MARKTPSRLELRKQVEAADAAEAQESATGKKVAKKKATRKKTTRKAKEKALVRRKLLWGVFSGSMKEEARFEYNERDAAEKKADQLRARSSKLFFIQPIKEPIADAPAE